MRGEMIKVPALKAGHHRPARETDVGLVLNSGLVSLRFSGDLDQYCKENIFL